MMAAGAAVRTCSRRLSSQMMAIRAAPSNAALAKSRPGRPRRSSAALSTSVGSGATRDVMRRGGEEGRPSVADERRSRGDDIGQMEQGDLAKLLSYDKVFGVDVVAEPVPQLHQDLGR